MTISLRVFRVDCKKSLLLGLYLMMSYAVAASEFEIDLDALSEMAPPPGSVIGLDNIEQYEQLIDPEFADLVKKGWVTVKTGESISFKPHANFVDATKTHAGKTSLGSEPGVLNGYIAGRPFSGELSMDDPQAGTKLMWNMRYGYAGDGGKIPEMYWQYRDMRSQTMERELEFEAEAMRFMHRHVVAPTPSLKDNPYKVYNAITLTALEPGDVANTKLLLFYNSDDLAEEQGWMYVPLLRRVRRVATTMRTDSFLGSDIMIEDFLGYTGRVKDMDWTYGGDRYILLPMYRHDKVPHANRKARSYKYKFVDFHGHSGCFPNITWQLRKVHVLEGVPKREDHPLSKRFFYIDSQTMFPVFGKVYDRAGVLWKFLLGGIAHPDHHLKQNAGSGVPMLDSAAVIDIQNMHCTTLQMVTLANLKKMKKRDFEPSALNVGAR